VGKQFLVVASVNTIQMAQESTANEEAWARAEGVPSLSDPFVQKYLAGRDALVQQEKKQRSGRSPPVSTPPE